MAHRIQSAIATVKHPSLEIGVGSGRFAQPLGIPCGLEPARSAGLIARDRGIEVIQGRGEQMPFPMHTFRTVMMITVLCFLNNPIETIREVNRIFIPEGRLIVAFSNGRGPSHISIKNILKKGVFFLMHIFIQLTS